MENPAALARTVRDLIAHQPELVNEVWCRKIFRHILLALERSHTLHLPHAPISPDTIGFDAAGDAILLPPAPDAEEHGEAADVQALGAVVHYAITGEPGPLRPLRGLAPGYSESLVAAVDRCISPDPAARPQSIEQLRNLLGIVSLGPAVPNHAPQFMTPVPLQDAPAGKHGWLDNWQRWLWIGLAGIVLLAGAAAFLMLLRGADTGDNVVLTLPEPVPPAKTLDRGERLVQAPPHVLPPSRPAPGAAALPAPPAAGAPAPRPPEAASVAPPRPAAAQPAQPAAPQPAQKPPAPPERDTTYKLMIKPWGTVYVDGDERGVSPPLKKLALPAGRHTVRISNPNFRDRVIRVDAGKRASGRIDVDFTGKSR